MACRAPSISCIIIQRSVVNTADEPTLKGKLPVNSSLTDETAHTSFGDPGEVVARFFNSIFGRSRSWPDAYDCLSPTARDRFEAEHGLRSFADYWEDKLSFLEEIVKRRHGEFPYTHRTCFTLERIEPREISGERAKFGVELIENHAAAKRLVIVQTKILEKHEGYWLLLNGELEGSLDNIIIVNNRRARRVSTSMAPSDTA